MTPARSRSSRAGRPRLLILNLYMVHPPDTGAKVLLWNRIVELSRRFEVTFCCLDEPHKSVPPDSLRALERYARVVLVEPAAPDGPAGARDEPLEPCVRAFREPVRSWLHGTAARALRREAFDLVEIHSSCWFRRELTGWPGLKVLVAHNDEAEYWRAQADALPPEAPAEVRRAALDDARQAARQQAAAVAASDVVVALSERDARRLRRLAPGTPVLVNRGGVDCGHYDAVARSVGDPRELVCVATFVEAVAESTCDFAREVLPRVQRRHPGTRLTLVGDHRDHPGLLGLRRLAGVEVTGRVEDVRPALARAGVVVVPVAAGAGVRVKLMEACAAGRAIVTTAGGAAGLDLVDGTHALVTPDIGAMAGALARVLSDAATRQRLAAAARGLAAAEFHRRVLSDQLADAYEALLVRSGQAQPDA